MNTPVVHLQARFDGHREVVAVMENRYTTVAVFRDEQEAREWARVEYGDDVADALEWDR